MQVTSEFFPSHLFQCTYEEGSHSPIVVAPNCNLDLIDWAQNNQMLLAKAIDAYGAIVFSGFNLIKDNFSKTFEAITGFRPQAYKGDVPRDEVSSQVYKSTAVANSHTIGLHQEVSGGNREEMPKYISFFCVSPPKRGTGQTLVGNVHDVTTKIKTLLPNLWQKLLETNLTYTSRYLPRTGWRAKLISWLNPSHATILKRFGTEDKFEIEAQCKKQGLTCSWDGDWLVVTRKGIPGTITVNGETLFCNEIHHDKLSPKLCGGWLKYILARILLYPTFRHLQFDVQFDDGQQISPKDASAVYSILQESQEGRSWKKGDLMILNNLTTMHAKTKHIGEREIIVAMGGKI
ncbi:Taurine catabolism dioxygenase TauD, TfdA family [Candidatus Rubidus massiliensis]|nr:Taurine catabolism dioxygenase TauD, TfdA family [Candidatus Rubidus massiliensis]